MEFFIWQWRAQTRCQTVDNVVVLVVMLVCLDILVNCWMNLSDTFVRQSCLTNVVQQILSRQMLSDRVGFGLETGADRLYKGPTCTSRSQLTLTASMHTAQHGTSRLLVEAEKRQAVNTLVGVEMKPTAHANLFRDFSSLTGIYLTLPQTKWCTCQIISKGL